MLSALSDRDGMRLEVTWASLDGLVSAKYDSFIRHGASEGESKMKLSEFHGYRFESECQNDGTRPKESGNCVAVFICVSPRHGNA